jgi:aspartate aminotransferase
MVKDLSSLTEHLEGQKMFKILAKAKEMENEGKQIIHFELGDPDFDTPKNIVNAVIDSLRKGETHYAPSQGLLELRVASAEAMEKGRRNFKPDLKQILVTAGANVQIDYAIACTVNQGEEVIVPDPGFVSYFSIIKSRGAKAIRVPLHERNEFRLNPNDVKEAITDKTKMIVINSPSNPTGSVMTEEEIREIYKIAEQNDIYLLSDEIYTRMIYDDSKVKFFSPSMIDKCKERTIVLNGFSKTYAMTGWRLGIVTAPEHLIEKMNLLLETSTSCVSPFIQRAGVEALKGTQEPIRRMIKEYQKRRDYIVDGLNSLQGIRCLKPNGAFYVFPNITQTEMSSQEFTDLMLDKAGVAISPGPVFGNYGEGYVRLCYVNSMENIENGIERMREVLK